LMCGKANAKSPQQAYYIYWGDQLHAIRSGKWKLHLPHKYRTLSGRKGGSAGQPVRYDQGNTELSLYDLENDIGETKSVADQNPQIVQRLKTMAQDFDNDLKQNKRPAGKISG
jgi:arylsulfatase A